MINWALVVDIAVPIFTLILGVILTRLLERQAKVTYYLSNVGVFKFRGKGTQVNTHNIVITNSGKKAARNVRVVHNYLPKDFDVFPNKVYEEEETSGGGKNIKFADLVPGETVTISYLYSPPITYQQINFQVRHDDGLAKQISVLPMRQYPKWQSVLFFFIFIIGIIASIYLLILLIRFISQLI